MPNSESNAYAPQPAPVYVHIGHKKYLNASLETKNPREDSVKYALLALGIATYYEYARYPLSNGRAYYPDFITSIGVNGRQVVLEPHSTIRIDYMEKLKEFVDKYNFYLILISNKPYSALAIDDSDAAKLIDEYWFINGFKNDEDHVKENSEKIRKRLSKLLRRPEAEIIKG
ncbi:MAG: hypothetical protein M1125_04445 [Candidatus Marsarchaeota archaeon]|nr:hypothetical protein [Candidatus Marsarchaeota archaeon]